MMAAAAAAAGGAPEVIAQLENAAKVLMVRRAAALPRPERRLAPEGGPRRIPLPSLPPFPLPSPLGRGARGAARRGAPPPPPRPALLSAGLPPSLPVPPPPRRLVPVAPQPGPATPRRSSMCRPLRVAPGRLCRLPAPRAARLGCGVSVSEPPHRHHPPPRPSAKLPVGNSPSLSPGAGASGTSRGGGGTAGGRARPQPSGGSEAPWAAWSGLGSGAIRFQSFSLSGGAPRSQRLAVVPP